MLYQQHLRVGVAGHAVMVLLVGVGSALSETDPLVLRTVGIALPVTLAGAVTPDLDEPRSRPYRQFRPFVAVMSTVFILSVVNGHHHRVVELVEMSLRVTNPAFVAGEVTVICGLLAGVGSYYAVSPLLRKPTHRDLLHQLPTGTVIALVLYPLFVTVLTSMAIPRPLVIARVLASAFLVGFVSHLAGDGLLLRRQTYIGKILDEKF